MSPIVSRTRSIDAFFSGGTVDVPRRDASNGLDQKVTVKPGGQAVSFTNDANGLSAL